MFFVPNQRFATISDDLVLADLCILRPDTPDEDLHVMIINDMYPSPKHPPDGTKLGHF